MALQRACSVTVQQVAESAAYLVAVTSSKPRKSGRSRKRLETEDAFKVLAKECEQAGLMAGYPKNSKGEYALITDENFAP